MKATSSFLNKPLRAQPQAALERLRATLELAHGLAGAVTGAEDIKAVLDDLMGDCAHLIRLETEAEQPCSDEARSRGCSCREGSHLEYEPEPIIDPYCCLHGSRDPDHDAEDRRERRAVLFDEEAAE